MHMHLAGSVQGAAFYTTPEQILKWSCGCSYPGHPWHCQHNQHEGPGLDCHFLGRMALCGSHGPGSVDPLRGPHPPERQLCLP